MKRLLTLSALLLFSVDVFADDKICKGGINDINQIQDRVALQKRIEETCKDGDLLWVVFRSTPSMNAFQTDDIRGEYCSFEHEISLTTRPDGTQVLQCILRTEPRTTRDFIQDF